MSKYDEAKVNLFDKIPLYKIPGEVDALVEAADTALADKIQTIGWRDAEIKRLQKLMLSQTRLNTEIVQERDEKDKELARLMKENQNLVIKKQQIQRNMVRLFDELKVCERQSESGYKTPGWAKEFSGN